MKKRQRFLFVYILVLLSLGFSLQSQDTLAPTGQQNIEEQVLEAMFTISSHDLFDYVKEMCLEKYSGRLTGTPGYNLSATWLVEKLEKWGLQPGASQQSFYQDFPNPYTLVFPGSQLVLHIPVNKKGIIEKYYRYQDEFFPGSTSGSGEFKGEVIYVGYGITAPELGFDEYKGLNVKDKIVLLEREVPVSPSEDPDEFKKWRPYSFHQYKIKNAREHGAVAVLYHYHIVNPNCLYFADLLITNVGQAVVDDLFAGTGKTHKEVLKKIENTRRPQSFKTGKTVYLKNKTEHHADGIGRNVIARLEGNDPALKNEIIILSAHLDHLGMNHEMMPGANDNASGVAVIMDVARALATSKLKPKRTILFIFFGAEEQGVAGSEYYLQHPVVPNQQVKGVLNLDGVGRGTKIYGIAGKNYPDLWCLIENANNKYIHREVIATGFHNRARPRLDAAHFMWAQIPTISFSADDAPPLDYEPYHTTRDNPGIITPEIMEDLAQLLLVSVIEIAGIM